MSVTVKIPTQLRSLTGGAGEVQASGTSVAELIEDLERAHPGISERLVDETGALRRFVNFYVAGEDVRFLDGIATPVHDGAEVSIIPAVAGGALGPGGELGTGSAQGPFQIGRLV